MVVWRSRPRHPPEKKKLGSFASRSCNDGKKKSEMHVQNRCFANLTLLLFCWSFLLSLYMHVWIHGHRTNHSSRLKKSEMTKRKKSIE